MEAFDSNNFQNWKMKYCGQTFFADAVKGSLSF
jgi:hypothetical protein